MSRSVTFTDACHRCVRKGAALWLFNRLHPEPLVAEYCRVADVVGNWIRECAHVERWRARVSELETSALGLGETSEAREELFALYARCFEALLGKGMHDAAVADGIDPAVLAAPRSAGQSAVENDARVGVTWRTEGGRALGTSAKSVEICARPCFVVGSPRSGTSALAWALNEHSDFQTSSESEFLYYLFAENGHMHRVFRFVRDRPDGTYLAKELVSWEEFLASLGFGINRLFTTRTAGRR